MFSITPIVAGRDYRATHEGLAKPEIDGDGERAIGLGRSVWIGQSQGRIRREQSILRQISQLPTGRSYFEQNSTGG
jgi:hypothetical protein